MQDRLNPIAAKINRYKAKYNSHVVGFNTTCDLTDAIVTRSFQLARVKFWIACETCCKCSEPIQGKYVDYNELEKVHFHKANK